MQHELGFMVAHLARYIYRANRGYAHGAPMGMPTSYLYRQSSSPLPSRLNLHRISMAGLTILTTPGRNRYNIVTNFNIKGLTRDTTKMVMRLRTLVSRSIPSLPRKKS